MRYCHGLSKTVEYETWQSMKRRCYNTNFSQYHDYGGRGITMSESWLESFINFYNDMGPRPSDKHSIDRKDNDGPYCKENCKWSTKEEQNNNQRSNKLLTYNGKTQTVTQWAKELNCTKSSLQSRLALGWTVEDTLSIPLAHNNPNIITYNGVSKTITVWSKETGISTGVIRYRLNSGLTIEEALTNPVNKRGKYPRRKKS